jgi:hypothetical protein
LDGIWPSTTHSEGFADDASLTCRGPDLNTVLGTAQEAIDKAVTWANSCGLKLCHKKPVAVIFTNQRKFPSPTKLRLYGEEIEFSESVKYLRVLIDSKLSWKPHKEEKIKKALSLLPEVQLARFGAPVPNMPNGPIQVL